jgi:hypothetical protein
MMFATSRSPHSEAKEERSILLAGTAAATPAILEHENVVFM